MRVCVRVLNIIYVAPYGINLISRNPRVPFFFFLSRRTRASLSADRHPRFRERDFCRIALIKAGSGLPFVSWMRDARGAVENSGSRRETRSRRVAFPRGMTRTFVISHDSHGSLTDKAASESADDNVTRRVNVEVAWHSFSDRNWHRLIYRSAHVDSPRLSKVIHKFIPHSSFSFAEYLHLSSAIVSFFFIRPIRINQKFQKLYATRSLISGKIRKRLPIRRTKCAWKANYLIRSFGRKFTEVRRRTSESDALHATVPPCDSTFLAIRRVIKARPAPCCRGHVRYNAAAANIARARSQV